MASKENLQDILLSLDAGEGGPGFGGLTPQDTNTMEKILKNTRPVLSLGVWVSAAVL